MTKFMIATRIPDPIRTTAPLLGPRFAGIMISLIALLAHEMLIRRRHIALIGPLCSYINRLHRRFTALMGRIEAGSLPRRDTRRPRARVAPPRPRIHLPRGHNWLRGAAGHNASAHGSHLAGLLSEPETAALIAAIPQAARLLRTICRLLGLPPTALPPPPDPITPPEPRRPRAPKPPKPRPSHPPRALIPSRASNRPRPLEPSPCPTHTRRSPISTP